MTENKDKDTQSKKDKKEEEEEQEKKNRALRQLYEIEMENFEKTSNAALQGVRDKGVSVNTTEEKKKLPEQISDIHILISRQLPEFVQEGVDTSEELEEEINNQDSEDEDE